MNTSVKSHYDTLAKSYEDKWPAYNQCQIDWVIRRWGHTNTPASVLDIGCGTGLMLKALHDQPPELDLTGADISAGMLERAKKRIPKATFYEGNLEDKDFTKTLPSADVVISLSVLHHLQSVEGYFELLKSKMNDGGTLFLSAFARDGLAMNARDLLFSHTQEFHTRALSQSELRSKLETAFPKAKIESALLHPGRFWKVQIYRISA